MSEFLRVFSIIDLNVFGTNNIGSPITSIKNAVQSKSNSGKVNMRKYSKKVKLLTNFL